MFINREFLSATNDVYCYSKLSVRRQLQVIQLPRKLDVFTLTLFHLGMFSKGILPKFGVLFLAF